MKIQILAVEDDPIHIRNLNMFAEELNYSILKIVDNAKEALELLKNSQPDVLLVDIKIKGDMNGIDFAKQVKKHYQLPIIFITSYTSDNFFNEAKASKPAAYLNKPYTESDLKHAIELAVLSKEQIVSVKTSEDETSFFVKIGNHLKRIYSSDVVFIEVIDKYCTINTADQQYHVKMSLTELRKKLPVDQFIKVHRSFLVNLEKVHKIDTVNNKVISGKHQIPISRKHKNELLQKIQII